MFLEHETAQYIEFVWERLFVRIPHQVPALSSDVGYLRETGRRGAPFRDVVLTN